MAESMASKLRLMVVDDEPDNLDLLYRTFRREFEVFKANGALEALAILEREGEMGIIISDQRMPKMNGTEFFGRTVEQFPDTIRILLTGYTDAADLVGAINAGKVFKYVTKPWNPEELQAIVQQAAETYRVVKRRTDELHRTLRRESLFNAVTTAIRESLDYRSMLQKVVETIGPTFAADACFLYPVEPTNSAAARSNKLSDEVFVYPADILCETNNPNSSYPQNSNHSLLYPCAYVSTSTLIAALESQNIQLIQTNEVDHPHTQLIVPLTYQQEMLAALVLHKQGKEHPWLEEEIQLIEGVAEQTALAISQARLYQRIREQTKQMRTELAVARQIQMNLLRQSWPDLERVRIQAHCYPAQEVGGDFFEVFVHPQGDVWLAVGDVSGKGVPAALFMASAISLLRRELAQETSPEPDLVMQRLNQSLMEDLVSSNCFITMVLVRYTPTAHELVYANAGHIYPMVWSHDSVMTYLTQPEAKVLPEPVYLKTRSVPLGILPDWRSAAGHLTLKPGDALLLTSDGITEATIASVSGGQTNSGAMLKQAGLWQLLIQQQGELNLDQLLAQIQVHSQVQEDDQTILSLEVL